MALKTPPALVRAALPSVLALALASCGGGSTAAPVGTTAATSAAPRLASTQPASTVPPASVTTPTAPRTPAGATAPEHSPRPSRARPSSPGGASVPSATAQPGSSAAVADEAPPPSAPDAPAPQADPPASAPDPQPTASPLEERADLTLVRRISPSHYVQQGTVVGTYDGTMEVEARITSKGVLVRFTATLPGGTISGRGIAVAILDSTTWPGLRGTAKVTGGTGRFAGIHGRGLRVTGRAKPDASRARVRLAGTVTR